MLPAAGIVGVLVHPFEGLWKDVQSSMGQRQEQQLRNTRISEGVEVVKNSTAAQRAEILVKFMGAKVGTKDRKRKYTELAEKVMFEDKAVSGGDTDTVGVDSPMEATPPSGSGLSSPPVASQSQTEAEEDAAFERDLELAKQLSLAEQRGYERGLSVQLSETR